MAGSQRFSNCRDPKRMKAIIGAPAGQTSRLRSQSHVDARHTVLDSSTVPAVPMIREIRAAADVARRMAVSGGVTIMKKATSIAVLIALCGLQAGTAAGQTLDARRLGMGGVLTSDVGDHAGANIAFRAVPKGTGGSGSIPLPLGLIQYLSDHPSFDSKDSTFKIGRAHV